MFSCHSLAIGEGWHPDDYNIDCDSDTHTGFVILAALGVIVYPIGIPVSFFYLLRRDEMARAKQSAANGDTSSGQASTFDFIRSDYRVRALVTFCSPLACHAEFELAPCVLGMCSCHRTTSTTSRYAHANHIGLGIGTAPTACSYWSEGIC